MSTRVHAPAISLPIALSRLRRLLEQVPDLRSKGRNSPFQTVWRQNAEGVLADYFGPDSWQLTQFREIDYFPSAFHPDDPESRFVKYFLQGVETAEQNLRSRVSELEEDLEGKATPPSEDDSKRAAGSRKVFVVHGHDHGSKEKVARFLSQLELDPIILHEKPNEGRTIIEKFEHHADVACAVVILTPDDIGWSKATPGAQEERARQNVIFELGFFVSKLGRNRTLALLVNGVTRPSDFDGVLYIPMEGDSWKLGIVRELKALGMDIDANKAY
jgi:predicted nucleotide-binding protein